LEAAILHECRNDGELAAPAKGLLVKVCKGLKARVFHEPGKSRTLLRTRCLAGDRDIIALADFDQGVAWPRITGNSRTRRKIE